MPCETPASFSWHESIRTLYAPSALAAASLKQALAAAGYAAELRPEGDAFVVAYLAVTVAGSTIIHPQRPAR